MLNLQPLIARLVDDVFRAVRAASVEELRDLLAPRTATAPARARRKPAPKRTRPAPPARPTRQPAAPKAAAGEPATLPEPPVLAEITDPERLLSWTAVANGVTALQELATSAPPSVILEVPLVAPVASAEPDDHPPTSSLRPTVGALPALREGESVVRAAGAGLVIRRRRA
jgi:hypothetical protein